MELFISAPQLADLPLLVYVNKRDVVESMSTLQVLVGLNLHYLCNKSGWHVQVIIILNKSGRARPKKKPKKERKKGNGKENNN